MTEKIKPLLVTFLACCLSVPLFLLLAIIDFHQVEWSQISWKAWGGLVWWGVGTLGLGSGLWYMGLSRSEGTVAAGFMSVMPISALVLSYVLLGETFQWIHLVGIVLVMSSVALMSWVHASTSESVNRDEEK